MGLVTKEILIRELDVCNNHQHLQVQSDGGIDQAPSQLLPKYHTEDPGICECGSRKLNEFFLF